MRYILGIDLGTSYFKLALFDPEARLCGLARLAVPKTASAPGRCELEVPQFWSVLRTGIAQVLHEADATPEEISAIGYSSQANSFLLLDEADTPLTPLILWPDARAGQIDPRLEQLWDRPDFLQTTGLGLRSAEFMAAKICWLQHHAPEVWRCARLMTISDYLVYGATGVAAGDQGTAALLGLWDLPRQQWWQDALDLLEIPNTILSTPKTPGEILGAISAEGAAQLGLPEGIPFAAGGLDHHMAALGAGLGTLVEAVDSTGTVLALVRTSNEYQPLPGACMGIGPFGQGFYHMVFSNEGATEIEHYQREHAPNLGVDELIEMAAADPESGHGARIRAILESSARALHELQRVLHGHNMPSCIAATGGGARSDLWLQIKADLLGTEFVVTTCPEPACLGAAMLAAIATGWYADLEEASTVCITERKRFKPQAQPAHASV